MRCDEFDVREAARLYMLAQCDPNQLRRDLPKTDDSLYDDNGLVDGNKVRETLREIGMEALACYGHLRTCRRHYDELLEYLVKDRGIKDEEYEIALEGLEKLHDYFE